MSNIAFACVPIVYGAINIALMFACQNSYLGLFPWGLFWASFWISVLAAIASIPVCALLRRDGFRLSYGVAVVVCVLFGGFAWFNLWALHSASAAV